MFCCGGLGSVDGDDRRHVGEGLALRSRTGGGGVNRAISGAKVSSNPGKGVSSHVYVSQGISPAKTLTLLQFLMSGSEDLI